MNILVNMLHWLFSVEVILYEFGTCQQEVLGLWSHFLMLSVGRSTSYVVNEMDNFVHADAWLQCRVEPPSLMRGVWKDCVSPWCSLCIAVSHKQKLKYTLASKVAVYLH